MSTIGVDTGGTFTNLVYLRDDGERLEDPAFLTGLQQDLEPVALAAPCVVDLALVNLSDDWRGFAWLGTDVATRDAYRQRLSEQRGGNKS